MHAWQWQKLKGIDRLILREARLQAHYALQWLARAARAYVAPRPDDGHTNLRRARQGERTEHRARRTP